MQTILKRIFQRFRNIYIFSRRLSIPDPHLFFYNEKVFFPSMAGTVRISHRKMASRSRRCDLHKASFYANAADLWLFLFDSRNYYMDCIRMDENHILYAEEKLSAAGIDREVRIIFVVPLFTAVLYVYMFWLCSRDFLVSSLIAALRECVRGFFTERNG